MRNKFDDKFKEMIIQKYRDGERVETLSHEYGVATVTIYKWNNQFPNISTSTEHEPIDYEREYKKSLKQIDEMSGEMEALKKCIAIFSKK